MNRSKIEWTDVTWNPVRGCRRVSPGCAHCYAERQARRMDHPGKVEGNGVAPQRQTPGPYYGLTVVGADGSPRWNGLGREAPQVLEHPLHWRSHRKVFAGSMSDLFYEAFDRKWVAAILGVMLASPQLTWQVLTKRPERLAPFFRDVSPAECLERAKREIGGYHAALRVAEVPDRWPAPHIWIGTSVEDTKRLERVPALLEAPAAVHWLSVEPLLEEVDIEPYLLPTSGPRIGWVVAGGESGAGARPCETGWLERIVEDCAEHAVPCYIKQLGSDPRVRHATINPGAAPRGGTWPLKGIKHRRGGEPSEWPPRLRVRQFPASLRA